jgi:hypothetical protein
VLLEEHPFLPVLLERGRLDAESLAEFLGDDGKALTELVNKTELLTVVCDLRTDEEQPRRLGGFVPVGEWGNSPSNANNSSTTERLPAKPVARIGDVRDRNRPPSVVVTTYPSPRSSSSMVSTRVSGTR